MIRSNPLSVFPPNWQAEIVVSDFGLKANVIFVQYVWQKNTPNSKYMYSFLAYEVKVQDPNIHADIK